MLVYDFTLHISSIKAKLGHQLVGHVAAQDTVCLSLIHI